ncbi:unnamed protein product [Linum trigynum]|uniref:RNase H type-1 domain-containing protein n=1 Tax=Linum trigynum TaxID=586398 RepID=A0AAV2GUJ5_9ROSI
MAVVAILWRIWRSRNWVVFEGKRFGIPALMRQFNQQFEEWVSLPVDQVPRGSFPVLQHLSQEDDSRFICMWDGATRNGSHSASGMVLFDPARSLLLAKGVQFPQINEPQMVELFVLREAVAWCVECGLSEVRFEVDAKVLIDKINQADIRDSRLGAVLQEIDQSLRVHSGFSVRFVGRENNRVAYSVARKALSLYPTVCRVFNFRAWLASRM